ncbi:MAG: TY-Chap domain-containing protein [Acidimicrobiales bacterium]
MGSLDVSSSRGHCHTTVDGFLAMLARVLGSMAVDPRCFVMVAELDGHRYIQFWIDQNGAVTVETSPVSPCSQVPNDGGYGDALLRDAGWRAPVDFRTPNWWVTGEGPTYLLGVIHMTRHTLGSLMLRGSCDRVFVHFWTIARDERCSERMRLEARVSYHNVLRSLRRDLDGA